MGHAPTRADRARSDFATCFWSDVTPLEVGIAATATWYREQSSCQPSSSSCQLSSSSCQLSSSSSSYPSSTKSAAAATKGATGATGESTTLLKLWWRSLAGALSCSA